MFQTGQKTDVFSTDCLKLHGRFSAFALDIRKFLELHNRDKKKIVGAQPKHLGPKLFRNWQKLNLRGYTPRDF